MGLDIVLELEMSEFFEADDFQTDFFPILKAPAGWRGSRAEGWEAIYQLVGRRTGVDCCGEGTLEGNEAILEFLSTLSRGQWMVAASLEALVATAPKYMTFRLNVWWF